MSPVELGRAATAGVRWSHRRSRLYRAAGIRPKANRKTPRACDFVLYCERNLVERFFNQLKHFRAIATRYDKLARNFLAGVQMAAAMILLNGIQALNTTEIIFLTLATIITCGFPPSRYH